MSGIMLGWNQVHYRMQPHPWRRCVFPAQWGALMVCKASQWPQQQGRLPAGISLYDSCCVGRNYQKQPFPWRWGKPYKTNWLSWSVRAESKKFCLWNSHLQLFLQLSERDQDANKMKGWLALRVARLSEPFGPWFSHIILFCSCIDWTE